MTSVLARLRIPDGREFEVRDDWATPPSEPDSVEFYWSDGNLACDCNRARLLNRQHGLSLQETCETEDILLVSLKVDGVEVLRGPWTAKQRSTSELPTPARFVTSETALRVDGIDLSRFIKAIDLGPPAAGTPAEDDAVLAGLRKLGPVTITGTWDDCRQTCIVCRQRFTPGPEGVAILTNAATGERLGAACPACGIALVSPETRR